MISVIFGVIGNQQWVLADAYVRNCIDDIVVLGLYYGLYNGLRLSVNFSLNF
jgi:hypothetical protein